MRPDNEHKTDGAISTPGGQQRELSATASLAAYRTAIEELSGETRFYAEAYDLDLKGWHNGDADAFRHAAASAFINCKYGSVVATAAGALYEVHDFASWLKERIEGFAARAFGTVGQSGLPEPSESYSQLLLESTMDLYNDIAGLQPNLCRESLSHREIAREIAKQVMKGKMWVIKNDELWSSGPNGMPALDALALHQKDPVAPTHNGAIEHQGSLNDAPFTDLDDDGATRICPGEMSA